MSKVITFSKVFPSYHPRKGEETFFVEKIMLSLNDGVNNLDKPYLLGKFLPPKNHTIRAGNRWKVGDKFSPRVWSGKPYNSKQEIIAPDIEIKKVWEIQIEGFTIWINKELYTNLQLSEKLFTLSKNDGLSGKDFWNWFPHKPGKLFKGQIICWNENIDYS